MTDSKRLPPPLVLKTDDSRVGIRMEEGYDHHSMRRTAVILTVDGVDWTPTYCPSYVEAAEVVHALFSLLDRYGMQDKGSPIRYCTVEARSDNDDLSVWGIGEGEDLS